MRAIRVVAVLAFLMTCHTHLANMVRDPKTSTLKSKLGLPPGPAARKQPLRLRGGAFWFDAYASPNDKVAASLQRVVRTPLFSALHCDKNV